MLLSTTTVTSDRTQAVAPLGPILITAALLLPILLCWVSVAHGQPTRLARPRAVNEMIYLADTLGKMESAYLKRFSSTATVTNQKTNTSWTVPAEVVRSSVVNPVTEARAWAYRIAVAIPEPGTYRIRRVIKYTDDDDNSGTDVKDWTVEVGLPHALAPIEVDKEYYPGENPKISFGMRELGDLQGYTYSVRRLDNGMLADSGLGAMVSFGTLIEAVDNVRAEREFEARGYYHGKTFSYLAPGDSIARETIWRFKVRKPNFGGAVMWDDNQKTAVDDLPRLDMTLRGGVNPRTFAYYYFGRKGKQLILTEAKITNLQIVAEPAEFLQSYGNPEVGVTFTDVRIKPNEAFLQADPQGLGQLVELTLSFNTQFETNKRIKYRALVY